MAYDRVEGYALAYRIWSRLGHLKDKEPSWQHAHNEPRQVRHRPASGRTGLCHTPKFLLKVPQRGISYNVVFIESRAFTRRLHQLAGVSADEVLRQIQEDLLRNPEKGDVAQGLGGIRKARTSNPTRGKGKRGGYPYMHLYLKHRDHIHLLFLLDKDEQEDLTTEQRRNLRLIVAELKRL